MAEVIENKKKSRKVLRASFTRVANEVETHMQADPADAEALDIVYELLSSKFEELRVLDSQIYELLLETATEKELEGEMDVCDTYVKRNTGIRVKYNKLVNCSDAATSEVRSGVSSRTSAAAENTGMRSFKLPRIQLKQYNGSVKDWLSFWAQFKKVHEDSSIDDHDKIEYLVQSTLPGSRARQLVESYPAMGANYVKIIESMQSRFGREDLQIEVYVRELLKLILNNSSSEAVDIAGLYDCLETQLRALETLGITTDKCAAMLFPLIESCLPYELLKAWQRSSTFGNSQGGEEEAPSSSTLEVRLKKLMLFLRQEVENEQRVTLAAERFGLAERGSPGEKGSSKSSIKNRTVQKKAFDLPTAACLSNVEVAACVFCAGSHDSKACFKAQKMNLARKRDILFKAKACFRCLKIGHQTNRCRERLRCVVCSRSHVAVMCPDLPINKDDAKPRDGSSVKDHALANYTATHVFLQTLVVPVKGVNGIKLMRALIDTGSQRSYISNETAVQLGCQPKCRAKIIHSLFGGTEVAQKHNCYDVMISKGTYSHTFEVLGQPKICNEVAPVFHGPWIQELSEMGITISDQHPGSIELLLGSDVAGNLYTGGRRELTCGLIAVETFVGWTLMGKVPPSAPRSDLAITTLSLLLNDASISELWDLETLGIREPSEKRTREEMAVAAKEFFQQTVKFNEDGRYEVRLPWLEGHPPLPTNYKLAQKRLSSTAYKLEKENLREEYAQIFQEWYAEDITEQLSESKSGQTNQGHYLPHRPVVKNDSATTKIRPVFDASAHEKDQPSLNHCLEKGPNLIELIPSLLLRFRENKIGVVSDIRKAFLQISINERDRDFLKFLWLDSNGKEITLRHKRVVFGLNSSPFLLAATLEYHLARCRDKCSKSETAYSLQTVEKLSRSFYVDNCVTSLSDDKSVSDFIRESIVIMEEGSFQLRGWEYTRNIAPDRPEEEPCSVLGLEWYPQADVLTIHRKFLKNDLENMIITKRQILSLTQKVFDPIGYLCPAMLIPKLLLQTLWQKRLTWDQPIDDESAQCFKAWVKELHYLGEIIIPRWIGVGDPQARDLSIHTFCDASQNAYACAIFVRVTLQGKVGVFLLAAKARVAPIKRSSTKITIPRLELLAATIGARLYAHVAENLVQKFEVFFWSDSSTVISWIKRKEQWGVFVWNRVEEIRNLTASESWRHLPGIQNPADLASRGCSPKRLFESKWWEGPRWLYDLPETWPRSDRSYDEEEVYSERRKGIICTMLLNADYTKLSTWHLNYFSKHHKTIRMIAWVFRFIHNCRNTNQKLESELSAEEYNDAEIFVFKLIQRQTFSSTTDERIGSLRPFYDEAGLIRLKTRVSNREDTEDYRFPIILPKKHPLVDRLIMDKHINSCHVGTQGLLSLLREKFWILGGRRYIRCVISKCVTCKRYNAKPFVTEPPPLPVNRVRDAVAFEITGVDFAGPLFLKNREKVWICIFTCAVFRAVHLELTTSLSTSSFLNVLRRFVSRRGRPKTIYSDNGTNFLGAANAFLMLDWQVIVRETSVQRIQWRFNPPTAAWWGGFWERLIGVLKGLLRKTLGRAVLDYEDLLTLICECEAIVNARPLTYLSEDPKDLIALSPSMFLRDLAESGLPDCDAIDGASLNRKVRKIHTLRETLRKRFRSEYLGQLKLECGRRSNRPVMLGDLVLVGNDNSKRLDWPIARVVEVIPGKDDQIRLVRVETSRGQMLRPIQRLYPLECCVPEFEINDSVPEGDNSVPGVLPDNGGQDQPNLEGTSVHPDSARTNSENLRVRSENERITRSGRVSRVPLRFDDTPN